MYGPKAELTEKQKKFVEEYLVDLNATQAAIRAGYSPKTASDEGYKLVHKGRVASRIAREMAERSRRTGITQDRVLRELARVAFLHPENVIDFDTAEVRPNASVDDLACVNGCKVKTMSGDNGDMVEREVKLADKVKALDMLCRHLGMYPDKTPGTPSGSGDAKETGVVLLSPVLPPEPHPPDDEGDADG